MTREEILAMRPGSALDELVAERVMGWKVSYNTHKNGRDSDYSYSSAITDKDSYRLIKPSKFQDEDDCFQPSTDIAAAWEVVEHMRQKDGCQGCKACIEIHGTDFDGNTEPCDNPYWACIHGEEAGGDTAPEAICKAALLAVMEDE